MCIVLRPPIDGWARSRSSRMPEHTTARQHIYNIYYFLYVTAITQPNTKGSSAANLYTRADQTEHAEITSDALVRITWRFPLRGTEGSDDSIDSESIFLVDAGTHPYRILAYINPRDVLEALRRRGISA